MLRISRLVSTDLVFRESIEPSDSPRLKGFMKTNKRHDGSWPLLLYQTWGILNGRTQRRFECHVVGTEINSSLGSSPYIAPTLISQHHQYPRSAVRAVHGHGRIKNILMECLVSLQVQFSGRETLLRSSVAWDHPCLYSHIEDGLRHERYNLAWIAMEAFVISPGRAEDLLQSSHLSRISGSYQAL